MVLFFFKIATDLTIHHFMSNDVSPP